MRITYTDTKDANGSGSKTLLQLFTKIGFQTRTNMEPIPISELLTKSDFGIDFILVSGLPDDNEVEVKLIRDEANCLFTAK